MTSPFDILKSFGTPSSPPPPKTPKAPKKGTPSFWCIEPQGKEGLQKVLAWLADRNIHPEEKEIHYAGEKKKVYELPEEIITQLDKEMKTALVVYHKPQGVTASGWTISTKLGTGGENLRRRWSRNCLYKHSPPTKK